MGMKKDGWRRGGEEGSGGEGNLKHSSLKPLLMCFCTDVFDFWVVE